MKIFIVIIMVLLVSCATYAPRDSKPLARIANLNELNGRYHNLGEGASPQYKTYLSDVIWGKEININHETIDEIRVSALTEDTIRVEAISNNEVVKVSQFERGSDFEVLSDRVRIHNSAHISGDDAGNLFLGPIVTSIDLGLDTSGDGKYVSSEYAAGVVGLVIPVVGSHKYEVRFRRILNQ